MYVRRVIVPAPVEVVFAFHERPDALARLSPPFPPVTVVTRTGGLAVGARVHLRIGPISWHARHTAYVRNQLFVDEQERGPFRRWVHHHEFEACGDGTATQLTDRVEFELPGGPAITWLLEPFLRMALARMFTYRHRVTVQECLRDTPAAEVSESRPGPGR